MRRASAGLLLSARRALADTSTQHHHHPHQYTLTPHLRDDGSCVSSAFAHVMPCFEHTHGYAHKHHHQNVDLHIPCADAHATLGLQHRHLPLHPHHHPLLSALRSISHACLHTRRRISSAVMPTIDPHAAPLATSSSGSSPTDPFIRSTYQQTSIEAKRKTEPFSLKTSQHDLSSQETHKLIKLIKVEDFKKQLLNSGKHYMALEEVIELCKKTGTATSNAEAEEIAKALDEAGLILIFRKRVFLEPKKVADILARAMPLPLTVEEDPRNREFAQLLKEKDEIDLIAHKQVRSMLWGALGALSVQSMLFFRLTFWELSWDVMEPICFFVTSSSLLAGFFFFVITKRDPSYHDFMDTLFSSKQRKLIKKKNFDVKRFQELQGLCCLPSSQNSSSHRHISHAL